MQGFAPPFLSRFPFAGYPFLHEHDAISPRARCDIASPSENLLLHQLTCSAPPGRSPQLGGPNMTNFVERKAEVRRNLLLRTPLNRRNLTVVVP
jgi:hypothetical protein